MVKEAFKFPNNQLPNNRYTNNQYTNIEQQLLNLKILFTFAYFLKNNQRITRVAHYFYFEHEENITPFFSPSFFYGL